MRSLRPLLLPTVLILVALPAFGQRRKSARPQPPAPIASIQAQGLTVTAFRDGSYSLSARGIASPVLRAQSAAQIDFRWLPSSAYAQHQAVESAFQDDLGSGRALTVTHSGLPDQPDLVCIFHLYQSQAWGDLEVRLRNNAGKAITVQAIRSLETSAEPVINLGGPASSDRILSDSYSEDRPALKIMDLSEPTNGMHRAVGSQLIYNRQSGQSLFLGALTSNRLLTILHLKFQAGEARLASYDVTATGTTEILKGESLKESPPEDQIALSVPVNSGESLSGERLMFAIGPDYHAQLEAYGRAIRQLHKARVSAPTPMGWWSWTAYYFGLSQGTALTNAGWLAEHLKELGYDYFHMDEGYQYARGEYATPDASHFPRGVGYVGDQVRRLGLTFGVWTAPFEVSERSSVFQNHKDWLVHNAAGQPIHLGHVNKDKDQLYALDPTNPAAQDYLRQTYRTLVHDWGVRYIKLDFMDDSTVEGFYSRPHTTALEAQRIGLQVIRDTVGDEVLLDKDGSPMLNPVGLVDTGRTSVDTGHTFAASREALPGIAARYYMNRNFFIDDPDAFTVSRQTIPEHGWHNSDQPLTLDEAKVSIALSAVSGGMYEIGDDLPTLGLDADRLALVQNKDLLDMARLGHAAVPLDLMTYATEDQMPSIFLLREDKRQAILAVFNWTEQPRSHTVSLADLKLPSSGKYQASDALNQDSAIPLTNGALSLENQPPHSVRVLKLIDTSISAAAPTITADVPSSAKAGEVITLSAHGDPAAVPALRYRWDFGDGTHADGPIAHHAYTITGSRTVKLTVDGIDGVPAEKTFTVEVTGAIDTIFKPAEKRRWQP
ncbi:MAG TPA: alpha-galactosidase [Terriglobales bacterium]|nr:alpha-galactosidase [Terriglobales bacterium]